jgi:hypothetical protein
MRGLNKLAIALIAVTTLGACVVRGSGHARIWVPAPIVVITAPPPPPPRAHVHVTVRPGYIWIEGRQHWDGNRYVWHDGYYERERPGHRYHQGHWRRQGNGHVWVQGRWEAHGNVRDRRSHGRSRVQDHR